MTVTASKLEELRPRLIRLYGERAEQALTLLGEVIGQYGDLAAADEAAQVDSTEKTASPWSQEDVVLITYGDQVQPPPNENATALQSFQSFLQEWRLTECINTVHFLPIFPWSSDDGFAVIDYLRIDPAIGTWDDVLEIGQEYSLMFDFVVNHVSQQSQWFQSYLAGEPPFDSYFIEVAPEADVSGVTRPRSLPLLHEFDTSRGPKLIWTTFSRDQVDLDYSEPRLLAAAIEVLLEYIRYGARIIRLDAIAYLWKELGTTCIHLPHTHEVVKLMRQIVSQVAPHVLLLTETNVPHEENVSYFGDGDEAHMVYQFSLPPLLLDAFLNEDATPLKHWLAQLEPPRPGTTYFNFTASHDGVGVRPLEGHVESNRLNALVEKIKQRGGRVSMRGHADGSESPYELNIAYLDALADETGDEALQLRRFLGSQALMMSLQGMPAVYFHSLVGTPNYHEGVERSGINRRINRRKYRRDELNQLLIQEGIQSNVFQGMQRLIGTRIRQPAFHPDATQRYVESDDPCVLMLERIAVENSQRILVVLNLANNSRRIEIPTAYTNARDLISDDHPTMDGNSFTLAPAQIVWLEGRTD